MKKSDFKFDLPEELIAQRPLPERGASRLLHLQKSTGKLQDKHFSDFIDLIRPEDLLVFNDTKVIPARLFGHKTTGGKVEVLIERVLDEHTALAQVRAGKSLKLGGVIQLPEGYFCEVQQREGSLFKLEFKGSDSLMSILEKIGHIPLPPYIDRADDQADRSRYQSIFAREAGAVAAPTASLHFDEAMLAKIKAKGIETAFVTLHVGSGTFQPVRVEDLSQHEMHKEYFAVSQDVVESIIRTKNRKGRVVAIGTTAVRALESSARNGQLAAGFGDTGLFITPGYHFNIVDAFLTNFHLPESTLIMLVAAFAGYEQVMAAYSHAIGQSYRFFSYGDAMFLS